MRQPIPEPPALPNAGADAPPRVVRRGLLALVPALPLLCGASNPGGALFSSHDLQLVARVLGFLARPLTGLVEAGIVYPGGNSGGRAQAERLATLFEDGVKAGSITLRPRLVAIEEVASARLRVLLLTDAAVPQAAALARVVADRNILTVTSEQLLVDEGLAVLAVRSQPRVEILVSRVAAEAAGIAFAGAFRMMIQER